jgi:hypothetical protein
VQWDPLADKIGLPGVASFKIEQLFTPALARLAHRSFGASAVPDREI